MTRTRHLLSVFGAFAIGIFVAMIVSFAMLRTDEPLSAELAPTDGARSDPAQGIVSISLSTKFRDSIAADADSTDSLTANQVPHDPLAQVVPTIPASVQLGATDVDDPRIQVVPLARASSVNVATSAADTNIQISPPTSTRGATMVSGATDANVPLVPQEPLRLPGEDVPNPVLQVLPTL